MAIYTSADQDARDLLAAVMKKHHPEFLEIGLRVAVLMAHPQKDEKTGEPKGPALKRFGHPVAALFKVNSQCDRVAGKEDADMRLDAERWEELTPKQRAALLHTTLLGVEVRCDDEGNVLLDDCHRPKVKLRPSDFLVSGFYQVAQEYREDAPEVQALAAVCREFVQLDLFDLVSEPVTA